jgi:uncharacterized protein
MPGLPALCDGTVVHVRHTPKHHRFTTPLSQVWFDPDAPESLCDLHPAWSHHRPAPARYRRSDYGRQPDGSLAGAARQGVAGVLGRVPNGPVRMLTQIRRWGWLFNPITVYFVWDGNSDGAALGPGPIGAVLEVTNTPWKERVHYPVLLGKDNGFLTASFDKAMHVSPFLTMDHRYHFAVADRDDVVELTIGVHDHAGEEVLHTAVHLRRRPANRRLLGQALRSPLLPTHRVSAGIHSQALRLWGKRVPFVGHPRPTATDQDSS